MRNHYKSSIAFLPYGIGATNMAGEDVMVMMTNIITITMIFSLATTSLWAGMGWCLDKIFLCLLL